MQSKEFKYQSDDDLTSQRESKLFRSITTLAQREIFLIEQTRPGTSCKLWFYQLIRGPLDLEVLSDVIEQITLQIPLLQTRFAFSDGELWQIYERSIQHKIRTIDVSTHSTPLEEALRQMIEIASQPCVITSDKLYDFVVYIVGSNTHVLYAQFHHSIIDVRSWAKLESIISTAYNNTKQGRPISVLPTLHFDALAHENSKYMTSEEFKRDEKFWMDYVQPLKYNAYTQRNIDYLRSERISYRCTLSLSVSERQRLQQTAAALNLSESIIYIGVSALLLRSLLGNENVSLSLPVRGTQSTHELGMTSNVVPLLLHIPDHATINDVLVQIAEETKSVLTHQRFRIEEIRRLASFNPNRSFGPYINILRYDHGEEYEACSCSSYFGGGVDTNELQIRYWVDDRNGRVDILLNDIVEVHSEEQLASLKDRLNLILELVMNASNSNVTTLDALDERCRKTLSTEQSNSFYTNRRMPVAAGFLQWSHCAYSLVRSVHANMWVGSGPSPFATSKVLLSDRVVSICMLRRVANFVGTEAPGKILKIGEIFWRVAVADGVVEFGEFIDECGQHVAARVLAQQCQLLEGDKLPIIRTKQAEWLSMTHARAMRSEIYWSQLLASSEPLNLSIIRNCFSCSSGESVWATTAFQSSSLAEVNGNDVLVAWLIYIARDAQMTQLQIGWDATESNNRHQDVDALKTHIFAITVPFSTCIELEDTFLDALTKVERECEKLTNHLPCLSDLFVRHATVANHLHTKKPWALAVSLIEMQCVSESMNSDTHIYPHGSVLTLQIHKQDGSFRWIYDKNQISEEDINRISSRLFVLLASAYNANQAHKPVGKLDLLPKSERELLINIWNRTNLTYPSESYIHQLFEEQVKRDGSAIAVECEGETMSYAELNVKANILANYLIVKGVKPDDRIAVCVKRGKKMLIALLGILKAAASYIPIDPAYSSQRLKHILKDADPLFLLADETGQNALGVHHVSLLDLDKELPDGLSVDNPDPIKLGLTPSNLAYVIYTSGSTGKPKGVMVEHRQVINLLDAMDQRCDFTGTDVWCLFHSFSFDFSVSEISTAWYYGGKLVIVTEEISRSPSEFYQLICEQGVTVLNHTPSALKVFQIAEYGSNQRHRLRWILFGGEPSESVSLRRWYSSHDRENLRMLHMYGPTETTVFATSWMYDISIPENAVLPIGRPLPNTRIYLLDVKGEPVTLGAEGEIYVGGASVARGYLNRPELTAESFLPDRFSDDPTARMYRTGDRARYLPDGNLVYLGRTDQQVKIRGFRIEPGEIEARLVEHPLVREAIVLSWKNRPDTDARLVAYVVADPDTSLAQNLRTYLASLLPEYMVPAAFVCLSSLPLTTNGKLDRHALPPPNNDAFVRQLYEAPQGEMEDRLATLWSELLHVERISRHDNFFALGGHSLLIVRMLSQLKELGLNTGVREVFDSSSLAALAETLGRHKPISTPPNLIATDCTAITPEMLPLIDLRQEEIDALVTQVPGGIANIQDVYGMAPLQHGILFHHMMAEHGDPYLLISRMKFESRNVLDRYATALQQVIERHDILRTAFIWKGLNEPAQVVLRRVPSLLTEVVLNDTDEPAAQQLSNRFNPRHYKLNLQQAPLLRLLAAPVSDGSWIALQLMHHIIGDHVTLQRLNAEVQAIVKGHSDRLATPTPFRHVVAQARLSVSDAEHTLFFSKMLSDIDTPTLPFGLKDVHHDGVEVDEAYLKLPNELNIQLRTQARNFRVSLASLCHLGWAQVLARASGTESVVFGTVLLGRLQAGEENENAMGLLINTLPLRIDIDDVAVADTVRNTHSRLSALLSHEHASLALAQRCSGVSSALPLFSALLNCRHKSQIELVTEPPAGISYLSSEGRTNYPLCLSVDDDDNEMSLSVQVVSSVSAARICAYMQQALISLVDALTSTPQRPVRTLPVVPSEEREMLLYEWNKTTVDYSPVRCLHELFEVQVVLDGQAHAVECEDETLSYAELNSKANRLAHYLIEQGVQPDDRIALCVKRSTKMLVALMGILKSGCAYVPLDPVYTSQRLTNILKDANPLFLLADETGQNALGVHQVPLLDLDKELPDGLSVDNPDPRKLGLTPSNLAYVIYTSGSTGKPKGVMVEHHSIFNLAQCVSKVFCITSKCRIIQFASCCFDTSLEDIVTALTSGACLCLPNEEVRQTDTLLINYLKSEKITHAELPPAMVHNLQNLTDLESFQTLILSGETPPLSLLNTVAPFMKIINSYGPTEATITATNWLCPVDFKSHWIPIGRPLSNVRLYLLDSYGEAVPLGVDGDLYIGGAGVARGYLNRPELTAESFLPDRFSDDPTARMYRTGDRARYLPDGNLVYLGRTDQQVKIRGFRIEPGEIEARLVEHPLVREAIVLSWKNKPDTDARLVAYVVADPDSSLAQNLRTYLASLLPEYMVPAAFVCLSSLPLTTNGKLDRHALPPPNDDAFARQLYEAPQGEMEDRLATLWSELLHVERISRHDNFFALGGHSLLIVRMLSQLKELGLNTGVREVFDSFSLAALAETLGRHKSISTPPNLIATDCTAITPEMLPLIDLRQEEIDALVAQVPGGIANIQDVYGMAPLQHGILFHHMMAEHGDPYLLISRMKFESRNVLDRYATALQQVIERHDILRTAFIWKGLNEPAQVVLRRVPSLLTEVVLNATDEPAAQQLSNRFNPRHYKLNLQQAPLLRLLAAPASDGSWTALQLMHHIIGDHVTLERLNAEVQAIVKGHSDRLATPTPFRHVVAQARLSVSDAEHTLFFSKMLSDIDTPTLPFGLNDVHQDGVEVDEAYLKLPNELNIQLRAQARNFRVSLASLCHLGWAQVLARASGTKSVVFGTVLLGRLQAGEGNENAMGLLINTLPLRIDIDDVAVADTVRNTHSRLSALLSHEHASLALAQRCSGVSSALPLFSALLNCRHKSQIELVTEPPAGISYLSSEGRTNYPLCLSVDDDDNEMSLSVQVVSSVSAARICAYMQQALISLVDALTSTPQRPVRTLPVVPSEEREMLLYEWNKTTVDYSPVRCLHELFEVQVVIDGQAHAVECEDETLSYAELNSKANRLAHYLIEQGVQPDDRIALCVKRSTKMLVALMGILKSGCAYVPLDPVYTSQRLTNILKDANPLFLLADETGQNALGVHQVPLLDLDKELPDGLSVDNPDPRKLGLTPSNLAYVIYTSGSTGKPKGVMVEHQNVFNLAHAQNSLFEISPSSRVLLFASISFDVSLQEVLLALTNGACLCLPNDEVRQSDTALLNYIRAENISLAYLPPALFRNTQNLVDLKFLQALILGGEKPSLNLLKRATTQTVIFNAYGPTEVTMCATTWSCPLNFESHSIPVGRPLSNIRLYLLDPHGELVPLGAEGEIYVGGAGVARGYLNRPELTAESFLPDRFSDVPTARMYRTGDRARYLPDGNLVYLGRTDQQVKIRGFRIEPGEIEARLVEHPLVREAIVLSWKSRPDTDARLVAYVAAEPDSSLAQNLRTYLAYLLPEYMVPAAFVCLSSLPLTTNGKLDRHALPPPNDDAFARQLYEAPQGEMEHRLATLWSELLHVERVSRHDNFFALGGHSLLIVRMLSQLKELGLNTGVREVFDSSSLAALAETLGRHKPISTPPNLIATDCTAITPEMLPLIDLRQEEIDALVAQVPGGIANIQDVYGMAPLQHGILFHHMMAEHGDPYLLISRMKFESRNVLDRYATALQQVIERHDILRTAFIWKGLNEPAQVVLRRVPSLLTEVVLNATDEPAAQQLSNRFNPRHYKLNLQQAPLLRLLAAPASDGSWTALQLMHHIIGDHVTLERLNAEVQAIVKGHSDRLATPTPFRHVVAQARLSVSDAEHTLFFSKMLSDIDTPTLPFGLNDVHQDGVEVDEAYLKLPNELNIQLRAQARNFRVSLASLCHLGWAQVLARASGTKSVVFGTVLLGRLQAGEGNENAMGLLINTLPLRIDIDDVAVADTVRNTHSRLSALLSHEHASLALAQRCSGVSSALPLFSALLNCRHKSQIELVTEPPAGISYLSSEGRTNYPLCLSVDDDDNEMSLSVQVVSSVSAARICAYMQQALISLVDALTSTPQRPVRTLPVVPSEEREMLLYEWNKTTVDYSPVRCLHELFEVQVVLDGQAHAVECEDETLSYAELNSKANRLAHYLIEQGVQPDDRIALCVKRSTKMLVALMGILKSGCAYVPLDPVYTSQRLTNILKDANPLFLLADETGQNALGVHQVPLLDLDKELPDGLSVDNPDPRKLGLTPSNLAYVIYTSGSTGKPKGVMVEHQNVFNLAHAQNSLFEISPSSRVLLFASISFDVSLQEVLLALTNGACLCLPNDEVRQSDTALLNYIRAENISLAYLPPALFRNTQNLVDLKFLQALILGGEKPSLNLLKRATTQTVIFNAYGPTEVTMCATTWSCPLNFESHSIPVGRPLSNIRLYLLDPHGELVPLGAEGEIYVGGAGVARGYLNRPELTAESFLPDRFSDVPTARMYRTGDRARYLPDGNLVYLGRTDQQVKIRGFRIEPGEIEARLVEHPLVREAIVLSWKNRPDTDARLVAYVAAEPDSSLAQNLRTYLASLLPEYMVPAAFVCLSSLPLTPNGKLDQGALPSPNEDAFARQLYEAPQGEMEQRLAGLWIELLGVERISRHDNFFELGGHSLLVMQHSNQAKKLFNIHLDTRGLFFFPVLKDFVDKISHSSDRLYCDFAIPARLSGDQAPIFLLPSGHGDISYAFELARDIDSSFPVYVLPWSSPEKKPPTSIEQMAQTMIALIKKVQPEGPYAVAGYSSGGILAYEITFQLLNSGFPVSFLGLINTHPPTEMGPLNQTENFLKSLPGKSSFFETLTETLWWTRICKLTVSEAIEEVKERNTDLTSSDLEWEALLTKQRAHYINLCMVHNINSLPIRVNLFKATDSLNSSTNEEIIGDIQTSYEFSRLGWENYHHPTDIHVIPVNGNHFTMIRDPINRSLLGRKLSETLRSVQN